MELCALAFGQGICNFWLRASSRGQSSNSEYFQFVSVADGYPVRLRGRPLDLRGGGGGQGREGGVFGICDEWYTWHASVRMFSRTAHNRHSE